jgi:2-polyprenyl-6-hydroxyphenyl methylase/3-demethylubiquinone-9 3-methyltransferase
MRNDLAIYDRIADRWWSDNVRWVRTLKNLVLGRLAWFDRHFDWMNKKVLDLGCAGGFMAEALASRGARVTGIDPAEPVVSLARDHAQCRGLAIMYNVGVGEALPYQSETFDAVVCVAVLEHVQDFTRVVAESARVLRPGGLFLYDTINCNALSYVIAITAAEDILRILPRGTHDPAKFMRPQELRLAMSRAGLATGPIIGLGPSGIDRRLDLIFGPLPFTAFFMGIAHKLGAPC